MELDVVSTCPLRIGSILWQPWPSAWALTVVCRATYRLEPVESHLLEPQEDPAEDDNHWDDDEARSLYAPSDLAPFKARADVLLVGHAFAPRRQPVRSLLARMTVGGMSKAVQVWCDRSLDRDGTLVHGSPFVKMPLRYERAAGGPGTSNPVGLRFDAAPDARGFVPIPNLQPPGLPIARRGDIFAPTAFGPIAPAWPERVEELRQNAATWSHRRWNERPLPEDMGRAYFNAAPRDQQVQSLRPDERIVLENLHPEHPRLVTSLPGVRPRAFVMRTAPGAQEEVRFTCDTLWIDTDRAVCALVWRGYVSLTHPEQSGRIVVSMEGPATPSPLAWTAAPSDDPARDDAEGNMTIPPFPTAGSPEWALPFARPTPVLPADAPIPWVAAVPDDATGSGSAPIPDDEDVRETIAFPPPPPMIGPLAKVDMGPTAEPPPAEPPPTSAAAAPTEPPPPAPFLPLAEFPLEQCAAIAASIARTRAATPQILDAQKIAPETWIALDRHWNETIRLETTRGKTAALKAYDEAYVAQLEQERGAIQVDEYARLVVATERGSAGDVLVELTLPRAAAMRIERVWLGKIAADAVLAGSVGRAVESAREQ